MFRMPTAKEMSVAHERARPTLSRVLSALLRSGVSGYFNWQHAILAASEWASAASVCGPCYRSNPEDVKQIFRQCGVILDATEYAVLRNAYSDSVGFILTHALLHDIEPLSHLPTAIQTQIICVAPQPVTDKATINNDSNSHNNNNNDSCNNNYCNSINRSKNDNDNDDDDDYDSREAWRTDNNTVTSITQKVTYVLLDEVTKMIQELFLILKQEENGDEREENDKEETIDTKCHNGVAAETNSNMTNDIRMMWEDANDLFCSAHYPHNLVPLSDLYNFLAAECLLMLQCTENSNNELVAYNAVDNSDMINELEFKKAINFSTHGISRVNGSNTKTDEAQNGTMSNIQYASHDNVDTMQLLLTYFQQLAPHLTFYNYSKAELSTLNLPRNNMNSSNNVTHHPENNPATLQRKFERYCSLVNRRDEWLRGREEKDARDTYQRHVVGYAGHLPEYQYHFGRTFHVIEEDLPKLSRPHKGKTFADANTHDDVKETITLPRNCMNEHHFRFS